MAAAGFDQAALPQSSVSSNRHLDFRVEGFSPASTDSLLSLPCKSVQPFRVLCTLMTHQPLELAQLNSFADLLFNPSSEEQ